ncbi:MAG: helix-turn-helix domain-containing protein, partial [Acidobacteriota bacterium]
GNVRELGNVVRRLALLGEDPRPRVLSQLEALLAIAPQHSFSPPTLEPPPAGYASRQAKPAPRRRLRNPAKVSEEELQAALKAHGYRMRKTAEALGLSRIGLYRRLEASPNARKAADLDLPEIENAVAAVDGDLEAAALSLRVSLMGLKRRINTLRRPSR